MVGSCRCQSFVAFTAFTAVGLAVQMVHGDGKRGMGFLGNGAVGHRAGLETLYNGLFAFYFGKGNACLRVVKVKQTS